MLLERFLISRHKLIMSKKLFYLLMMLITISSCKQLQMVKYETKSTKISDSSLSIDSSTSNFLKLFRDSLAIEMNSKIAYNKNTLTKSTGESTLGNFLADALLSETKKIDNVKADFAVINLGGIRLPQLPAGDVTIGKVYELMPFDNAVVILDMNAEDINSFFNYKAAIGGWPIAGASYRIRDGKAINISINGEPLQSNQVYKLAISDYLADGGDKLDMLKKLQRFNTGVLLRDMFISFFKLKKVIEVELDGRIKNEN
jgi:2',3'-cyclic-nucleotide 2'-phosphodiesterase (5'-nucleotidase family)